MTVQELEILLAQRCKMLDLKKTAFETLDKIFIENSNNKDFLYGFGRHETKTIFDRFEYQIERWNGSAIIKTRIGLYVVDNEKVWLGNLEPIGYYELETDFNGEIVDDWFVLEKEK